MDVTMYNCEVTEVDTETAGAESIYFRRDGYDQRIRVFISPAKLATLRDQITAALKETHEPATD